MKNILCAYLKGLTHDYINYISNTIMNNFIEYKQKMISKKLKNIFVIYAKQELLLIQKNLLKWYHNGLCNFSNKISDISNNSRDNYFHLNLNVGPIMNNSRGIPIIINNNTNNNANNNANLDNNQNYNDSYINTKKGINQNSNNYQVNSYVNKNHKNVPYGNDYKTINDSLSKISSNNKYKKRPYSSGAQKKIKKYMPIDNNNRGDKSLFMKNNTKTTDKIVNKFIKRQENYKKNNSQKKEKIIKDNEEEYKLIYTFEPKVNDSLRKLYKKDKLSASNRLYNDSILRKKKNLEKKKIMKIKLSKKLLIKQNISNYMKIQKLEGKNKKN